MAAREGRVLVTENLKDFAALHDVVVVCVLKSRLGQQGMAEHLAQMLDAWATTNPIHTLVCIVRGPTDEPSDIGGVTERPARQVATAMVSLVSGTSTWTLIRVALPS